MLERHRVISAAEPNSFKPHAGLIGLRPEEILFVANHAFDCVGTKAVGMKTAFVNRRKRPFGNTHYEPDLIVEDFTHLARAVAAACSRVSACDGLRLRALEQAATPTELEDAEDTVAVLEWKARDAAGQTTFVSADQARRRLGMPFCHDATSRNCSR